MIPGVTWLDALAMIEEELGGTPILAGGRDGRHDLDEAWLRDLYILATTRRAARAPEAS